MLLGESMKKIMLAGIGTLAITAEKSKELVDELVTKGELTVEQGKVLNEELKHKAADKLKDSIQIQVIQADSTTLDAAQVLSQLEHYSPEEQDAIRKKLEQLHAEQEAAKTIPIHS